MKHLVALFVSVQLLDLATYLMAPHLEANPAMAVLPPFVVACFKVGGIALALAVVALIRTPWLQSFGLALGIALGAFGVGANVASLASAAAPRPAPDDIPTAEPNTAASGEPVSGNLPTRTGVPSIAAATPYPSVAIGTRPAPSPRKVPDRAPGTTTVVPRGTATDGLRGRATWFAAPSGTAAAGPALRRALGPHWRGKRVTVCGPAGCVRVRLNDWMRADKAVDLNPSGFRAACGPLSRGVCKVVISW